MVCFAGISPARQGAYSFDASLNFVLLKLMLSYLKYSHSLFSNISIAISGVQFGILVISALVSLNILAISL